MVIHNLDLLGSLFAPSEYDPPLIVDPDGMTAALSRKGGRNIAGPRS
jgi:hypothetical protein